MPISSEVGLPSGLVAWVLSDGKAGDEQPCLGVVEALGVAHERRHVAPRAPFSWFMPHGPVDPREAPGRPGSALRPPSPLQPPWPDLVVASGRRAVSYLRALKRASDGRCFTVFLKDPRTGPGAADFIWAPSHDRIRGPNVVATLTSPHRVSAARLAEARAAPDARLAALPAPRAAVLVGGRSRHVRFEESDIARLVGGLAELAGSGVSLAITTSRRTPEALRAQLSALVAKTGGVLWDGMGPNPYLAMLASADAVVVTADSVNMVGEALATSAPVLVFGLPGGAARHRAFLAELEGLGQVRPFRGRLEAWPREPLDTTPIIARAVAEAYLAHRARLDPV